MNESSNSEATLAQISDLIAKDQKRKKKKRRAKGSTTRLPRALGNLPREVMGLRDKLARKTKGAKFDDTWYARKGAEKAFKESREAGSGKTKSLIEGFKGFKETEKVERIAKTGKKTAYGEMLTAAGLDNLGAIIGALFEKDATKEEIDSARKSLGMPPLQSEEVKSELKPIQSEASKLQKPHQFELMFDDETKIGPMPFMDKLPTPESATPSPTQPVKSKKKPKTYADPKTWFALEAAKKKYSETKQTGAEDVSPIKEAFKEFRKTEKTERLAKTGRKTGYGEFFKGAGLENVGAIVEALFDKRGSTEEIEAARKELNLKPLKETESSGRVRASGAMPKQAVKTESGELSLKLEADIKQISEDVTYIKERLAPKIIEAKGEKGTEREGQTQKVSFDPLAPEGEQYRKVDNETGKVLATKVDNNFMKSASWKAANLSQRQGLQQPAPHLGDTFSLTKKPEPKSIMGQSPELTKAGPEGSGLGDPTWDDPSEQNVNEFAQDPVALLRIDMNENFTKVFEILDEQKEKLDEVKGGEGGEGSGILGAMKSLKTIGPTLLKMGSLVGKVLGPAAAVGLAAYAGYKIGEFLNEKFGLSEKLNNLLEKVGVNDYDPNKGQKTSAQLVDEANTREGSTLAAAGLKQVGVGQYEDLETGKVMSVSELSLEQQKAVDLNRVSKTEGDLRKEIEERIKNNPDEVSYPGEDGKLVQLGENGWFESNAEYEARKQLAIDYYIKDKMAKNESERKRINEEYAKKAEDLKSEQSATPAAGAPPPPPPPPPTASEGAPAPSTGGGTAAAVAGGAMVAGGVMAAGTPSAITPTGAPAAAPPPPGAPPITTASAGSGGGSSGGGGGAPAKKIGASAGKSAMIKAMNKKGVTDPVKRAAIMAQVAHESGGFRALSENLNYSAEGLNKIFPKYFKNAGRNAADYARKPEKIANIVYGGRMGNGPEETGEGYLYRGRGFIQLTGKNNYKKYGVTNPDELLNPERAAEVAVDYMMGYRGDWNDIRSVTKYVNGGFHGLEDRAQYFEGFKTDPEVISDAPIATVAGTDSAAPAGGGGGAAPAAMAPAATMAAGGGASAPAMTSAGGAAPAAMAPAATMAAGGGASAPAMTSAGGAAPAAMASSATPSTGGGAALQPIDVVRADPVSTVTPTPIVSGQSIDTGTRQLQAAATPSLPPAPGVNVTQRNNNNMANLPSRALPEAQVRSAESAFSRAISRDFAHPSTFTSVTLT